MNVIKKTYLASLFSATALMLTTCTKPIAQEAKLLSKNTTLTELVKDSFSRKYTDVQKVIEYNKFINSYKNIAQKSSNYLIVNKKQCNAIVYSPVGDTLKTFKVILGKSVGDKRAGGYWNHEINPRCYTTPGEYKISYVGASSNKKDKVLYGNNLFFLQGDHTEKAAIGKQATAIHQIPDSRTKADRLRRIESETLKDNRKSFGCVELTDKDCEDLKHYIGKGSKVYILPEEAGNALKLEKQKNNGYKFVQTKYQ